MAIMNISSRVVEKAFRMADTGKVEEIARGPNNIVYWVHGDHGTYTVTVTLDSKTASCTCPATAHCSHQGAALLVSDLLDRSCL